MRTFNLGSKHRPDGRDIVLPSGQTCKVRSNISYTDLVSDGIISRDGLIADFPEYGPDASASVDLEKPVGDQVDLHMDSIDIGAMLSQIIASEGSTERLWSLVDRFVRYTVIAPKIRPVPAEDEVRAPNAIYSDYIELDDRAFLFNYALGGSDTVEGFASELTGSDRG